MTQAKHAPKAAMRTIARAALPSFYRGHGVVCPCCGGSFRRFMSFASRPNARCPKCWSLERHRVLWLYLTEDSDLLEGSPAILHFAPEFALRRALRSMVSGPYVTADLEASSLADISADITDIPVADGSFDLVLCNHVLEHVPDDATAIAELFRVLRPGGTAVMQYPVDNARELTFEDASITSPAARRRAFGQWDHVRLYGRDHVRRLAGAGFEVTRVDRASHMPAEENRRRGLVSEPIYVCLHPHD
jgi:Methyltransferase domain